MDIKNINFLSMVQTTQTCLFTNKPIFKDIPGIVLASTKVDAIVAGILAAQRQQASGKEGLVDEKFGVRMDLAEAAHEIAALAHACANEHGLAAIAKRTDLSLSDVRAGTEGEFLDRCQGILADANELTDDLGECGVTPKKLKDFGNLIESFATVKPKPRAGASVTRNATNRLEVLRGRAGKVLRGRLDRLMVQFKKSHPDFYGQYKAARKIVQQAATHETAKSRARKAAKKTTARASDKPAPTVLPKSNSTAADKSKVA